MSLQKALHEASLIEYTHEFVFGLYVYRVKTIKSENKRKVFVIRSKNEDHVLWHHGVLTQKLTAEGFKPGIAANPPLIFEREQDCIAHLNTMELE
jgi:hypothetical protein